MEPKMETKIGALNRWYKSSSEKIEPVNADGEIIREATVFHFLPTRAFEDHTLGLEYHIRWLRTSRVRQVYENRTWKTVEFLDCF